MTVNKALYYALVPLIIIAIFGMTMQFDFAWLDQYEILDGALIVDSFDDFLTMFIKDDGNHIQYHRPLYNLMHTLDWQMWGANPTGFHLSSVFLHAINALLLLFILSKFQVSPISSLLMVGVWAVMPIHATSVGLIHAKADLLSTFFLFLGVATWFWKRNLIGSLLTGFFLLLALLSKEVALAGIAVAAIYISRLGGEKNKIRNYVILGVPVLVYLIIRLNTGLFSFDASEGDYLRRLATFPIVYGSYFFESLPGIRLGISDAVWAIGSKGWSYNALYLSLCLAAIIIQWLIWRKVKSARPFIVLFNLMLLPVAQIVPIQHFRADRFLYLSSFGWVGMFVMTGQYYLSKRERFMMGLFGLVILIFGVRLAIYLPVTKNDNTLFSYTYDHFPECRESNSYLGKMAMDRDDNSMALLYFSKSLNANPDLYSYVDYSPVRANLGTIKLRRGQYQEALELFDRVEGGPERYPKMYLNIGICYKMLGRPQEAYDNLVLYQKIYPDELRGMEKMAEVYVDLGRKNKAIEELNRILYHFPNHENAAGIKAAVQELQMR